MVSRGPITASCECGRVHGEGEGVWSLDAPSQQAVSVGGW